MKKKLLRQMLNEWRTNVWLALEFLVVSVVLWYICDYFYASMRTYFAPLGFEYDHCYELTMYDIPESSPEYRPEYAGDSAQAEARYEILRRLKQMPEIEAAAYSNNARPFNGSNSGFTMGYDSVSGNGLRRFVTPDFPIIYRYRGVNGESPEELARQLEEGKVLLSDNFFSASSRDPRPSVNELKATGKKFQLTEYTVDGEHPEASVGSAMVPARYDQFNTWSSFMMMDPCRDGFHSRKAIMYHNELTVRVRPEQDHDIAAKLMAAAPDYLHVGNNLLTNVSSLDDIRRNFQRSTTTQLRNYSVGMGFMMINIFLGLLGTFWFRTQQRVNEIAIRRVNGATRSGIFGRLIGEGVLLLALVTPLAIAADCLLMHYDICAYYGAHHSTALRIAVCAGTSFVLMALMVIAGIWFPARRAMRIEPAQALSIDN
ncbi:FtsX-like permease family protein [Paramuribaculum intestinale]|uniref:FtsX-like permease family protein n=1 Tax=Paramuribaculum intestinale TaxID=2094151 RepID=UPI002729FA48|nr:FtsX-like permease family protein [Paramuribaculum intestinale]